MDVRNTHALAATRFKHYLGKSPVYCAVAIVGLSLGMVTVSFPAPAVDASPRTWAELTAERGLLVKQFLSLNAAGKTGEAMAEAEKLIETDGRLINATATNADQKKLQQVCWGELCFGFRWLVQQHYIRQEWSAAGKRQQELADFYVAIFGKADFRAIDARNEQVYFSRLSALRPDEAGQLAKADKTNATIIDLLRRGDFADAVPLAKEVVQIRQRLLGDASPRYAASLNNLAELYEYQGDYSRAEPLCRQSLEIKKKALGENHPDYAASLNNLAMLYEAQGDYVRPEPLLRQASEITKKAVGENHPGFALSLNNLALLYDNRGDYARAEPLYHQASEICKKALGESHPDYARTLCNLALLYHHQGSYARAESLYVIALEIRKKALGENHPDIAQSLNNLAGLYQDEGDYARAEPLLRKASDIKKMAVGENHPDYARSLNNLAGLYRVQGDYARAEPLYRQASEILKKAMGENHPDYANSLNGLALLYGAQGDNVQAEPLYRQAAQIWKNALGENHPNYATSLNNLASLYQDQGDYARAESVCVKALEIRKKTVGENHPDYAHSLNNLASLYQAQGDYARAEPLLHQASEITKKAIGETHPDYALSLNNLGGLYKDQGDYARAEPLFIQASKIRKKTLGVNHPDYATSLSSLASLYWSQGDYARAEPLLQQAVLIERRQLEVTAVVQSERHQLAMLRSVRPYLDGYLALTAGHDQFWASAYQQMLAWKGIIFRRERLARAGEQTPELLAIFRKLQQAAGQLAKQAWATPDPKQEIHWRENVARLSAEKESLEAELSERSAAYRQAKKQVTLEELQQALPEDAVLVDILQYRHYTPADKKAGTKQSWQQRLLAFVISHNGPVVRVNLGPEQRVREAIDTWRVTFGMSPPAAAAGRLLRHTLWEPIEAQLAGAKIVLVSPDGAISRLPLGALPGKEPGSYLLEERTLAIVPVAQMIPEIVQEEGRKELAKNLLLLGNINYDAQADQAAPAPASVKKKFGRALPKGLSRFDRLPGTQGEVASIEKLYRHDFGAEGILALEEGRATKTAFLAEAGKYRYVHLATHGFFVEEKLPVPMTLAQRGSERFGEMLRGPEATGGHAGLLCGLALAGANRAGGATGDMDDGILTAEEIGAQNLDGVQMVMLSACETGLGKAAGGEGLLGLQRSFQAAGARTVVASLWQVPDTATRNLMEHFYENHWEKNMGVLPALREAQLTMLREGRQRGVVRDDESSAAADPKRAPPYYWAAFVLSGDWR
jgi:CHAT domain-containing protein/Tfp pilus assembly protein PilF